MLKKGKKELSEKEEFSLDLYSNKEMKQDTKKQYLFHCCSEDT